MRKSAPFTHSSNHASSSPALSRSARPTRSTSEISAPPNGAVLSTTSISADQR
jgi:hypothetical protein